MLILPVIHHISRDVTMDQAWLATVAGADGVFLISHHGEDAELLELAGPVRNISGRPAQFHVGVNLLGEHSPVTAFRRARDAGFDSVWMDRAGVDGAGAGNPALAVARLRQQMLHGERPIEVFAGVAFKYQADEPDPVQAARNAQTLGFVPTTSGSATGHAPLLEKVEAMSRATGRRLAVASGLTPDNIAGFAPHLSHALVATGVSVDAHHFDFELLSAFVARARACS